jgi:hypothetical protein
MIILNFHQKAKVTVSSKDQNLINWQRIPKINFVIKIKALTKSIIMGFLKSYREISKKEITIEAFQL